MFGLQDRRAARRQPARGQARLHVGYALRGQRVAAQIRPAAVVVDAVGLLQLVEHAHKTLGCEARWLHQPHAHTVGLALHVARKIELVLQGQRLAAHHQRLRGARVLAGRQRAQHHRAQQQRRLPALLREQT